MPTSPLLTHDPLLNKANLDRIKRHIIDGGQRCTYVNMYNHNPCWQHGTFHFFLNPDPGPDGQRQWNLNCDLSRGDFNTLVIRTTDTPARYAGIAFLQADQVRLQAHDAEDASDRTLLETAVADALRAIDAQDSQASDEHATRT